MKIKTKSSTSLGKLPATVEYHRGTDIGSSLGTHLHIGSVGTTSMPTRSKGAPGFWSAAEIEDFRAEAREEGRRTALRMLWDRLPHVGQVGILVNTGDTISLMDHSNGPAADEVRIVLLHKDFLFPESAGEEVPTIVSMAIDELQVGWYQDDKADLYYYEGESHWKEVDLATNKKLTEDAILGKLEFIG